MLDHIVFGATNYEISKAFFLKVLQPIGVEVISEGPLGVELCRPDNNTSLCIRRDGTIATHLHIAFTAENRQQVDDFYRFALAAGGRDNGAPGLRPEYNERYYAAFVIGPDEHNIEMVCHNPEP